MAQSPRISRKRGGKLACRCAMPAESAGCEALRAEQAADEIRPVIAGREAFGNNGALTSR
jgi:hypothetical protein